MKKDNYTDMKQKKILIGICGGIAVYKIASLVNYFVKYGCEVRVIMTSSATQFVTPLTFQALTRNAVYLDTFDTINEKEIEHISLAKWADVFVVAPATANTISKIACGIADNLLTTVLMASPQKTKVIFAPAMNIEMWKNPILQKKVDFLKNISKKYIFIEPRSGVLACGDEGIGKLADPEEIAKVTKNILK